MSRWLFGAAALMLATSLAHRDSPLANRAERTVWDSVYSAPQSARGESLYVKSCARCHRASLSGGDESPPLAGSAFLANWNGETLNGLEVRIRTTMPSDSVGVLDRRVVTDVIAYLLKANAFPAGSSDLPSEENALRDIAIRATKP